MRGATSAGRAAGRDRRALGRSVRVPHGSSDAWRPRGRCSTGTKSGEAERDQERAERLRLYYVAMTRAIDRLIVSGAIDPERSADRDDADRLGARPARRARTVVEADDDADRARARRRAFRAHGRAHDRKPRRSRRAPGAVEPTTSTAPARALRRAAVRPHRASASSFPRSRTIPTPPYARRSTALVQRACALRALLVPLLRRARARPAAAASRDAERRTAAGEPGRDRDRRRRPSPARARSRSMIRPLPTRADLEAAVRGWYPERERATSSTASPRLVEAYCASDLAQRLAEPAGRPSRSGRSSSSTTASLLRGRLDVLWQDGDRALVVDYKSNALDGREPAEIVEAEYGLQRLVYALVCLRDGASEVEVAYQFLERPDDVVSTTFTHRAMSRELEAELSAAIARIRAGDFRPDAERVRLRGLPGARSRLRRAAPRPSRDSLASCASRRSATSTGTCRRSRRCSPRSSAKASMRSSSPATASPGRGRPRSSICSRLSARASSAETPIGCVARGRQRTARRHGAGSTARCRAPGEPSRELAADARARRRWARRRARLPRDPVCRRADLHAHHAGRRGRRLLGPVEAEVVVCGHTHMQYDRRLASGARVVNPGSVGMPVRGTPWRVLGAPRARRRVPADRIRRRGGGRGDAGPGASRRRGALVDSARASRLRTRPRRTSRACVARSYVGEARRRGLGRRRERIGPIIERLAEEHSDARDRAPLPQSTSSSSSP